MFWKFFCSHIILIYLKSRIFLILANCFNFSLDSSIGFQNTFSFNRFCYSCLSIITAAFSPIVIPLVVPTCPQIVTSSLIIHNLQYLFEKRLSIVSNNGIVPTWTWLSSFSPFSDDCITGYLYQWCIAPILHCLEQHYRQKLIVKAISLFL
jgi:hypothetical protein